ncbi:MAG: glycoside hydrolase family 36 protein [Candidatus Latescibacterota bacterium]
MSPLAIPLDVPPLSFTYGGTPSARLLPAWPRRASGDDGHRQLVFSEPGGPLQVTVEGRRLAVPPGPGGPQAVDWVVWLENVGTGETQLLEDVLPLDLGMPFPPPRRLRLHHANGSLCQEDDFLPRLTELRPGASLTLAPQGGRSSNGVLPFMDLQDPDGGTVIAVGWSGQWSACFTRDEKEVRVRAGMERTRLRLRPGERIRTPRILLLPWEGPHEVEGTNALRRLLLAHYLPRRAGGELAWPPVAQCLQFHYYVTGEAGEHLEMRALPRAAQLGIDAYWVDACWYGRSPNWWEAVGTWTPYEGRFPRGLRPIAEAAHAAGMKFVLWFEPERVRPGTDIDVEHPEFLLRLREDPSNSLFDLGNPAARQWLTDLLSARICEYGIDVYRQDFNFDPLPYWRAADEPERQGIHEIGHVLGLYRMWDELRARHPHLTIDNCASGGRRIDLETVSRALPLWASDFPDIGGVSCGPRLHIGSQCINAGLARWTPFLGSGVWNFSPYSVRSAGIGGWTFGVHLEEGDFPADDAPEWIPPAQVAGRGVGLLSDGFPMELASGAVQEHKAIRPFFTGDFYPLVPITVDDHDWCAWQFHRRDLEAGIALFFRRHRSPFPCIRVGLEGVDAEGWYELTFSQGYTPGPPRRVRGRDLAALDVEIPQMPGSVLVRYQRCG